MAHRHVGRRPLFVDIDDVERKCLEDKRNQFGLTAADYVRRLIVAAHSGEFTPNMSTFIAHKKMVERSQG